MKKKYVSLVILQPVDVDKWLIHSGKTRQIVASKSHILFVGPKQHKINASGSELYMNLKKKIFFAFVRKKKLLFFHNIIIQSDASIVRKHSRSNLQFFDSWDIFT